MGSSASKQHNAEKRMSGAALAEKRRKALEKHGVLLPPAFGVTGTPSQKGTGPPMSVQHRLLQTAAHQNRPIDYVDYLHETDLSTCVLKDDMKPGIWIAAQAATNTMIRLSVLPLPNGGSSSSRKVNTTTRQQDEALTSTTRSPTSFTSSQLFLEKKSAFPSSSGAIKGIVQFRTETDPGSNPSLSGSVQLTKYASLFASTSSGGVGGWLGAHYDRTFHIHESQPSPSGNQLRKMMTNILLNDVYANDPFQTAAQVKPYEGLDTMSRSTINCKLGSWVPIRWCCDPLNLTSRMTGTTSRASGDDDSSTQCHNKQQLHGYAAVNMLGATAAVHASIDGSFQRLPVWRSYFSANLNDVDRPPLQITVEHLHSSDNNVGSSSILCLSQVLAFDRWQLNPMEDRAPKVRNTVAWTVRVENCDAPTSASWEDSGAHHESTLPKRQNRMSLGAAWQINRGLAVKAVLEEHGVLTGAVLLKRWKQPRITCSILGSLDRTRGFQFLGVGIELETGHLDTNPEAYYYNHHPSRATVVVDDDGSSVPQTRATLRSDLKT